MAKKKGNEDKFTPLPNKTYLVTDQCFWNSLTEEEKEKYNPYDKTRAPHSVQLVDCETGTIVNLPSGSFIQIINPPSSDVNKEI